MKRCVYGFITLTVVILLGGCISRQVDYHSPEVSRKLDSLIEHAKTADTIRIDLLGEQVHFEFVMYAGDIPYSTEVSPLASWWFSSGNVISRDEIASQIREGSGDINLDDLKLTLGQDLVSMFPRVLEAFVDQAHPYFQIIGQIHVEPYGSRLIRKTGSSLIGTIDHFSLMVGKETMANAYYETAWSFRNTWQITKAKVTYELNAEFFEKLLKTVNIG